MSKVSVDRTVFVVGAGAGKTIQLPLGSELLNSIAGKLYFRLHGVTDQYHGDNYILDAIARRILEAEGNEKTDEYIAACNQIIQSVPLSESIDHLIHLHKHDEKIAYCAKLAIIRCILAAEEGCKLFTRKNDLQPKFAPKQLAGSWQTRLLQLLCRGVQFDGVAKRLQRTTFVIFNYDRCVETYFYEALQIKCGKSAEQVAAALNDSTFIHPYGRVGPLPWQTNNDWVQFGDENIGRRLPELAQNIKTFHEQQLDETDVRRIKEAMQNANRIAFLGFAYHRMNMSLLYPETRASLNTVVGTTYKMTEDNVSQIEKQIMRKLAGQDNKDIILKELDCAAFMEYFDSRLSFRSG